MPCFCWLPLHRRGGQGLQRLTEIVLRPLLTSGRSLDEPYDAVAIDCEGAADGRAVFLEYAEL